MAHAGPCYFCILHTIDTAMATTIQICLVAASVVLASESTSARAEVCPNALDYLGSTFTAAKQTLSKHFADRFYVNGPGCSYNDYELDLNDPRDMTRCSLGDRRGLEVFTVIGFSDIDIPLNVRYIFDGPTASASEVSTLLGGLKLVPTTEIPSPLRRLFGQSQQGDFYRSTDGKYLVRVFPERGQRVGHTIMVINLPAIAPARENISTCVSRLYGTPPGYEALP